MMKKYSIGLFVAAWLVALSGCTKNEVAQVHSAYSKACLSYEVEVKRVDQYGDLVQYSYQVMKNRDAYASFIPEGRYEYVDNDSILIIVPSFEEYTTFYKGAKAPNTKVDWYSVERDYLARKREYDIYSPFWNKRRCSGYHAISDTVIGGTAYARTMATSNTIHRLSEEGGPECRCNFIFYTNKDTKMITKIVEQPVDSVSCQCFDQRIEYNYSNFSFDENEDAIRTMMAKAPRVQLGYSVHNHKDLPTSVVTRSTNTEELTEELLDFPLVGVMEDTVTVRSIPGWILLESWRYDCPGCMLLFDEMLMTESNVFQQNGITLLAVNTGAANMDRLRDTASRYAQQFAFRGAKGLDKHIKSFPYPICYLISPEKRIVYVNEGLIDDYDTIVQITKQSESFVEKQIRHTDY